MQRSVMMVVVLVAALIAIPAGLAAQSSSTSGFPPTPTYLEFPRELLGDWDEGTFGGGNCGSLKDERGQPRGTCQLPVDKLEPLLNARARAWIAFFDEPLSPRWTCTAANVVTALGEAYLINLSVVPDAVLQRFEQSNWVRYIWTAGPIHEPRNASTRATRSDAWRGIRLSSRPPTSRSIRTGSTTRRTWPPPT